MGWACIAVVALIILGVIILATLGWQGLVVVAVGGLIAFILWARSKEGQESMAKDARQKTATDRSQHVWQQAARSTTATPCKTCGENVAPLAVVCSRCGVTLPGLRITCPKCDSESVSLGKKGFSVGQAAAGGIAVGPVGLAAGMIGSKDTEFVCLSCNHKWKASASQKAPTASTVSEVRPRSAAPVPQRPLAASAAPRAMPAATTKRARVKAEGMYTWIDDINKYRCDYCHKDGRYHYCKTMRGIKNHLTQAHLGR